MGQHDKDDEVDCFAPLTTDQKLFIVCVLVVFGGLYLLIIT